MDIQHAAILLTTLQHCEKEMVFLPSLQLAFQFSVRMQVAEGAYYVQFVLQFVLQLSSVSLHFAICVCVCTVGEKGSVADPDFVISLQYCSVQLRPIKDFVPQNTTQKTEQCHKPQSPLQEVVCVLTPYVLL